MSDPGDFYNVLLVRYGEIALKSKQTRRRLERNLVAHLRSAFALAGVRVGKYRVEPGRLFFFVPEEQVWAAARAARGVVGVYGVSPCVQTAASIEHITRRAIEIGEREFGPGKTFALRVRRRSGEHDFSSRDVAVEVGASLVDHFQELDLGVDLTNPDVTIFVEVRNQFAFLYRDKVMGIGGMPLDYQAPTLASFLGRTGDLLAMLVLTRRGSQAVPVVFETSGWEFDALPPSTFLFDLDFKGDAQTGSGAGGEGEVAPWIQGFFRFCRRWSVGIPFVGVFVPFRGVHAEILEKYHDRPDVACLACHLVRTRVLEVVRDRVAEEHHHLPVGTCDGDHPLVGCPVSPELYQLLHASLPHWTFHPLVGLDRDGRERFLSMFVENGPPLPRLPETYCPLATPDTGAAAGGAEPFSGLRDVTPGAVAAMEAELGVDGLVKRLSRRVQVVHLKPPVVGAGKRGRRGKRGKR
ncbi:MAG: THUMP domain-containing protein [Promethearchaeota archaeon]